VVILGTVAKHLAKEDPKALDIVHKLVEVRRLVLVLFYCTAHTGDRVWVCFLYPLGQLNLPGRGKYPARDYWRARAHIT